MKKSFKVTATGDSLFVAPFPKEYDKELVVLKKCISECDVKITNLETNLSDFEYFANAYSGGTWINTKRDYLKDLKQFDFNFYGTANNHCMDYAFNGLLSTIKTLDENNLPHAGTGLSLDDASKPAILSDLEDYYFKGWVTVGEEQPFTSGIYDLSSDLYLIAVWEYAWSPIV